MRVGCALVWLLLVAGAASAQQVALKCAVEMGGSAYSVYGTSPGPPDRICDVGCTVTTSDGATRSQFCRGVGLNAGYTDVRLCGEDPGAPGAPFSNPVLSPDSACRPLRRPLAPKSGSRGNRRIAHRLLS
jgi:hypothetical protein